MRSPRSRTAVVSLALAALVLTACTGPDTDPGAATGPSTTASAPPGTGSSSAQSVNVFAQKAQTLVPNPRLVAAAKQAAADGDADGAAVLERLSQVPTGIWLTPERFPVDEVAAYVSSVVASTQGETVPLFVVYGIPDRDCTGGYSAGGIDTPDAYLRWVSVIAGAAGGGDTASAVVLEPDALPGSLQCGGEERRRLLSDALGNLVGAGVTTYVDAGHSDWIPAGRMARLLREVGVERGRGFSTNVSNYQPEANEKAYAARLSALLDGAHYVIDVGRDGDPSGTGGAVEDWCNPRGRALGQEPGFVDDGSALDGLLWIKPPAESDGECHGGPPAGEVWVERAIQLGEAAGW